jgi:hypothetical protein
MQWACGISKTVVQSILKVSMQQLRIDPVLVIGMGPGATVEAIVAEHIKVSDAGGGCMQGCDIHFFFIHTRVYTPKVYIHVYTPTYTPRSCSVAVTTVTTVSRLTGQPAPALRLPQPAAFCRILFGPRILAS